MYAENILEIFCVDHTSVKGEIWQYNKFTYLYFRWESLLVENGLKIMVIVREGDYTIIILRRKGDNMF